MNISDRRVIILDFVYFARHFTTFTVDGEDFWNKRQIEIVKMLVTVRI